VRDACVKRAEILAGVGQFFSVVGAVVSTKGERVAGSLESHAAHAAHATTHATTHAGRRGLLLSLNNACLGGSEE